MGVFELVFFFGCAGVWVVCGSFVTFVAWFYCVVWLCGLGFCKSTKGFIG